MPGYCQLSNNCRDNHTGFNLNVGHHPKFLGKIAFLKAANDDSVGKAHQEKNIS
jgi:hypothetical protein